MEIQNTLKLIIILLFLDTARAVAVSSSSPSFFPTVIQEYAEYDEQNYTNLVINATVEYEFFYPTSNNVSPDKINSFVSISLLLIVE